IRVLPQPAHRIPIWIGGGAEAALERALRNDGYHALGPSPAEMKVIIERLRERRPDDEFVISARVGWDVTTMEQSAMTDAADEFRAAGVDNLHVAPDRGDLDTWLAGQETVAKALIR
ncbi:MAG TPA: LLM class flavin-dependent oxidoreductase, partial [Acidimicrobiia bacterium]|nr:LLM class flavin-dependent oxidoreductase [Acidimicrobiia bacterium]